MINTYLIFAVVVLLLAGGMAGYVVSNGINHTAPVAPITFKNATTNATKNITTVTRAATIAPTATPTPQQVVVVMPTATPTAVPTVTPTPATVTAQVLILSKPADVTAGSTVTITFQVFNSVTTAGMPGVSVEITGVVNQYTVTGANGIASFSFVAPQGIGSQTAAISVCSEPSYGHINYWGSCMSADVTVITPSTVGNATA